MINSAALLADLKRELRTLEDDLRVRADDEHNAWGARLREEHRRAQARERTGLPWIDWRDGEVSQAAVAWIIAAVFVRFAEDNGLLQGATRNGSFVPLPWIAAPGDGLERAIENESAFYAAAPTMTGRDWLEQAFQTLADLPAGRPLVDPDHSAVWHAPISADAADALLRFFRRTTPDGPLVHDFSDPDLGTRFLGDLYQDLSDYAKKTYALLQTPVFVEEFILDQTLTPAIAEFGLTGLKLIDPACGSGHFLLGAFDRLVNAWVISAPGVERGERVQRALNSIHGVDLNPFAVAIARFRLTVAAIQSAGIRTLVAAPAFKYHLAIGDSLLGSDNPNAGLDLGDDEYFEYDAEDLRQYAGILAPGQYHVVVANPPYITPPDASLRDRYRVLYSTCHGKYALTVPFMELLFRLAKGPDGGAGYVGQITSNSFMKREFGKKLIEKFLSGSFTGVAPEHVDLTHIIDTSGAYIPGHGTPTAILIGRPRMPQSGTVRAVLGVRGEPGRPAVPADGRVWREIVEHLREPGYNGTYVSVVDAPRTVFSVFPWSLSGGGAGDLKARLDQQSSKLAQCVRLIGVMGMTNVDDGFLAPRTAFRRARMESELTRPLVTGDLARDYEILHGDDVFFPYTARGLIDITSGYPGAYRWVWPFRAESWNRATFSRRTYRQDGRTWWEWHQIGLDRIEGPTVTFAFVATHNHFVLDRGGKVFKQSAPVIKLPEGATEDDHYDLLGVLNSSTACFWLKQVSYPKGGDPVGADGARVSAESWSDRYEFTGTKLEEFPLPRDRARELARLLDRTSQERGTRAPGSLLASDNAPSLAEYKDGWLENGRTMIALQEELDWRMYVSYGLADADLAPEVPEFVPIEPNERPMEIRLAREVAAGEAETAWFDRHGRTPLTSLPGNWPNWYRDLVERRLKAIESNPSLRLLERPEYKRRWNGPTWDQLLTTAVRDAILDRLEAPELWQDGSGRPQVRSIAQLADALRRDERLRELLVTHTGSHDYDLATELGKLIDTEAVPAFAALRYKPAGMQKFRAWERTWELQRAEDRGEHVTVEVPPKYTQADFLRQSYWSARGKLDVPKERFIAFPGSTYPEDTTASYGWAGWDHGERGQAIARFATELNRAGAPDDQVTPLVGALVEIEPWLKQWHDKIDARSGVSPAVAVTAVVNSLLDRLGLGRDAISEWRPMPGVRSRKKKV